MHLDVTELMAFYREDPLGRLVRRLLSRRIRERWDNLARRQVLGLGYATPFLNQFESEADRVIALMPAGQGVVGWPRTGRYRSALVDEVFLPVSDSAVDHVLAVHCLEACDGVRDVLHEIWRVLAPEGTLLLVVPNRLGTWASFDTSPFGHGRPFSKGQLERLLIQERFQPEHWTSALHTPPLRWRLALGSAVTWERLGRRAWPAFAGVILVEARKTQRATVATAPAKIAVQAPDPVGAVRATRI